MNWSSLSLFAAKPAPLCKGKIAIATTYESYRQLSLSRIVVVTLGDMDEEHAQELIDRRVKAVIHCGPVMSGVIPTQGPLLLLQHHILICEVEVSYFEKLLPNTEMMIYNDTLHVMGQAVPCRIFTREDWLTAQRTANEQASERWDAFIEDTLAVAMRDKQTVRNPIPNLMLRTQLEGRPVMIVGTGKGYKKDLRAAKGVIAAFKPAILGVGEGAEALLAEGVQPDIIIAKATQISRKMWQSGAELIVHTDPHQLGEQEDFASMSSDTHVLPYLGNSEDAALLLGYEKGGEWLITVGVRSHMRDFLAKGEEDMGSALLVRMKVGERLVDFKSLQALAIPSNPWSKETVSTLLLSLAFIGLSFFQLHWIMKRAAHVVWKLVGL